MSYIMDLRKFVGHQPLIMCCAGVLIMNGDKLLLQHRSDNDQWGIPGGALEPGESLEETARREVFEETGLVVGELQLLRVYSGKEFYYQYPNGDEVYVIDHIFVTHEYSGELTVSDNESKALQFFGLEDLPTNIHPPNRFVMKDFKSIKRKGYLY